MWSIKTVYPNFRPSLALKRPKLIRVERKPRTIKRVFQFFGNWNYILFIRERFFTWRCELRELDRKRFLAWRFDFRVLGRPFLTCLLLRKDIVLRELKKFHQTVFESFWSRQYLINSLIVGHSFEVKTDLLKLHFWELFYENFWNSSEKTENSWTISWKCESASTTVIYRRIWP